MVIGGVLPAYEGAPGTPTMGRGDRSERAGAAPYDWLVPLVAIHWPGLLFGVLSALALASGERGVWAWIGVVLGPVAAALLLWMDQTQPAAEFQVSRDGIESFGRDAATYHWADILGVSIYPFGGGPIVLDLTPEAYEAIVVRAQLRPWKRRAAAFSRAVTGTSVMITRNTFAGWHSEVAMWLQLELMRAAQRWETPTVDRDGRGGENVAARESDLRADSRDAAGVERQP